MKKTITKMFIGTILLSIVMIYPASCARHISTVYTLEDLQTKRIGVTVGSVSELVAVEKFPNAELLHFNEHMDSVAALLAGQIDGAITSWPTAFLTARNVPGLKYINEPLTDDYVGIAIRKGNDELLRTVDEFITEIRNNGILYEMETRWFDMENRDYVMPRIPISTTGDPLRIGVSANREPMTFIDSNGDFSGLDTELALRIGAALNRPIVFIDMRFSSLVPALESGQVDLLISNVSITEERKMAVNFTQPYNRNPQMMIVRSN